MSTPNTAAQMPCVLYYGLNSAQEISRLETVLDQMNIKGIKVKQSDLNQSIGCLVGEDHPRDDTSYHGDRPSESIIVMHHMPDDQINALLTQIRQDKTLQITLKAVVTEHNSHWPFYKLAAELREEHKAMQIYMSVRTLVKRSEHWLKQNENSLPPGSKKEKLAHDLKRSIERAYTIIENARETNEFDTGELEQTGEILSKVLNQLAF